MIVNTGSPQGCVLSAFLFIVYTNDMCLNNEKCKVIKYADDTAILGLVTHADETDYRDSITFVNEWCENNFLQLNVTKTKELVFNFRKTVMIEPVAIDNVEVEIVRSYKYLGVAIQNDLKWNVHIDSQIKKANKGMYQVRCLRNLNVNSQLICLLYNALVASVLHYSISSWYSSCSMYLKNDIFRIERRVHRMLCHDDTDRVELSDCVHRRKSLCLAHKIVNDINHPLNKYFKILPHGRYSSIVCKTNGFLHTFVPTAVRQLNNQ
jgi:hypothetical protein